MDHFLLAQKPTWDTAPDWAQSLGVPSFGDYSGEWCWFAGTEPSHVDHLEQRPQE